ncbi:uncharacterized protein LOC124457679 isoform X2 [Xenia sp. Carnegie-2017]|uniref:uncharacterized protein LOC124457679 isoform X2 n=1 Tax=Xenia sp. Carnegie-2017 TaxID=2897299 RepID=UPI001F038B93|nr:uncharacterized protein LOC124457679 isoform X2 [Xenia sp. Carnegie-2017]
MIMWAGIAASGCVNANWWKSFDKKGWSKCDNAKQFITGFYRSKLNKFNNDGIYKLEEAKCCPSSSLHAGQRSTCKNANWWKSLDKASTWSVCPNGYFLNGLYRTKGQRLHNIEEGNCCKPVNHPNKYAHCYNEYIRHEFDKKGWTTCKKAGYYVTGLYKDHNGDWLHNIDYFRCCKMWTGIAASGCVNANWWKSFDKKGWSKCDNTKQFITGFYRNKLKKFSNDGIYKLEEAKCCLSSPGYRGQQSICVNANWWITLDKKSTWSVCPQGYFLNGLYRTKGQNLHNIEEGKCCKPIRHPNRYGGCYNEYIRHEFDRKGWTTCKKAGYYVTGLYRDHNGDWLHNIDYFKCCKMAPVFNPCAKKPCKNGGLCLKKIKSYQCLCKPGYQGKNCGIYNACHTKPCINGGKCQRKGKLYNCKCKRGYFGKNCQYTFIPSRCVNANWWLSFDKKGWSKCDNARQFITGFYRNKLKKFNNDGIYKLEEAKCCTSSSLYAGQRSTCKNANWWKSLDKASTWSVCPNGYFLNGLYRTKGQRLHNIEEGNCCKPVNHPNKYAHCYNEYIRHEFDKKGWTTCKKAGYYVTGLYKDHKGDWLHNIDYFRCCKMWTG